MSYAPGGPPPRPSDPRDQAPPPAPPGQVWGDPWYPPPDAAPGPPYTPSPPYVPPGAMPPPSGPPSGPPGGQPVWTSPASSWDDARRARRERRRQRRGGSGALVFGLLLILFGAWLLFGDRLGIDLGSAWPVLSVAVGVVMVLAAFLPLGGRPEA